MCLQLTNIGVTLGSGVEVHVHCSVAGPGLGLRIIISIRVSLTLTLTFQQSAAMKCNGCWLCLYIRILVSIEVLLTIYFLVCTQMCLRFQLSQKSNHT